MSITSPKILERNAELRNRLYCLGFIDYDPDIYRMVMAGKDPSRVYVRFLSEGKIEFKLDPHGSESFRIPEFLDTESCFSAIEKEFHKSEQEDRYVYLRLTKSFFLAPNGFNVKDLREMKEEYTTSFYLVNLEVLKALTPKTNE